MNFILPIVSFFSEGIFTNKLFGITFGGYSLFLLTIFLSIILGKFLAFISEKYLRKLASRTETNIDDVIVATINQTVFYFAVLGGLYVAFHFLDLQNAMLISGAEKIISVLLLILVAWVVIRLVDGFLKHWALPLAAKTETELDDQMIPVLQRIAKILIICIFAIVILSSVGYDVTALIAGLGIGGIALAFAAQETVADMFGGFSIFTSRPFKVGDFIMYENNSYTIKEIGLRFTKAIDLNDRIVVIPNRKIGSAVLTNITMPGYRKERMNINITYDSDVSKINKAAEILKDIAINNPLSVKGKEPKVFFTDFKEYSLNLLFIYYIRYKNKEEIDDFLKMKHEINLKIKEEFGKAGIKFAYPTQTIHMVKEGS
ncbi:MAG: mechanosensitive ion channel domain-containing protein [archaeon]